MTRQIDVYSQLLILIHNWSLFSTILITSFCLNIKTLGYFKKRTENRRFKYNYLKYYPMKFSSCDKRDLKTSQFYDYRNTLSRTSLSQYLRLFNT